MRPPVRLFSAFLFVITISLGVFTVQSAHGQPLQYTASKTLSISKNGLGYFNSVIGDDKDYLYIQTSRVVGLYKKFIIVVFDKNTMAVVGELSLESTSKSYVTNCFAHEGKIYVFRIEIPSEKHELTCEVLNSKFQPFLSKKTLYSYTPARESAELNIKHAFGKELLISVVKTLIDPEDNKISLRCLFFDGDLKEIQNKLFPLNRDLNLADVNNEYLRLETALHDDGTLYIELEVKGYSRGIGTVNMQDVFTFYQYNYHDEEIREIEFTAGDDQNYSKGQVGDAENSYEVFISTIENKEDPADTKIKEIILKPSNTNSGVPKPIKISLPSEFLSEVIPPTRGLLERKPSSENQEIKPTPFRDIRIDHFIRDESGIILTFHSVDLWTNWEGDICVVKIDFKGDVIWKSKIERKWVNYYTSGNDIKIITGTNELYFMYKTDLNKKSLKEQRKQIKAEGHSLNYTRVNRSNGKVTNDNLKLPVSDLYIELELYQNDYHINLYNNQIIIQAFSKDGKPKKEGHYIRIFAN